MRALLVLLLSSCVAYNEVCVMPDSPQVGELDRGLDIRERTLRTAEAPAGNLVADALRIQTLGADVAIVPANAFSRATACTERDFVDRGVITQESLQALLPSEASIVLLSVTSDDLKRVLEHSVAELGGTPGEYEGFLQISNIFFSVDCAEQPQALTPGGDAISFPGSRVSALFVGGVAAQPGQVFKLATLSTITELGYIDLSRPGIQLIDSHQRARDQVAEYLETHSSADIEGRISVRDTCR